MAIALLALTAYVGQMGLQIVFYALCAYYVAKMGRKGYDAARRK